jgi:predicted Zn-dependent peptidase
MLNRKKGPVISNIQKLNLPNIDLYTYNNGVRVCEVNLGSQDIVKMEIIHHAGRTHEDVRLASRAVASLLKDGTSSKTSAQIAESIDYYGANIKTASNLDFSYSTLVTLTKHYSHILPVLHDMYQNPSFTSDEVQKFKQLNIQKLKEELTKNDVISYRKITEEIFGKHHPYGYNSSEEDYTALSSDIIRDHHNKYYGSDNCYIFLSGKITPEVRKHTEELFGKEKKHTRQKEMVFNLDHHQAPKTINLTSKNEHQSAIKIGRHLFNKNHADHSAFFLLNVILGGYFGSRLMMSIREEKGYTYDIGSSMDQMLYDGCFYVSTEAAPEYVVPIREEIYHQMDILKQEKVNVKELNMVKNYLMGTFLNMMDGPFNVSSLAKGLILSGKKPEDFLQTCDELTAIGPEKLMDIAQKYLNERDMTEVIVSPENYKPS